ncbi:zinc finger C2H2-type/integrase DNA-binding domain-containing protein [Tanacetum coccineum]
MRALYSSHIAYFQLGSRRAWKGDLGIGEEVVGGGGGGDGGVFGLGCLVVALCLVVIVLATELEVLFVVFLVGLFVVFVEENWSHGAEGKDSFVKCDMTGNDDFVGVQVKESVGVLTVHQIFCEVGRPTKNVNSDLRKGHRCGLISNEDTKTITWLFRSWLTCMSRRASDAIITDQDQEQYEIALRDRDETENIEDFNSYNTWYPPITRYAMEEQMKHVLTNAMFKEFREELTGKMYCEVGSLKPKVAETCWLRNLLRELHTPLSTATIVYCDNVNAVYLSSNPVQHQRTKHIEIDIHFVRDLVTTGHIRVLHVSSRYQYADIFTKGLPTALFDEFRDSLSVRSSPAQTAGGSKKGLFSMDKVTENCEKEDSLMMIGSSTSMLIKLKIPKPNNTAVKEGKRVCSVCKKEFSSSKALGGHMRVHVMYHKNGDVVNKPFKSGSKLFKRIGDKNQDLSDEGLKVMINKPYLSSVNDEGVPTCSQCGKSFPSMKSLFGHMRCHPERFWRGIIPPPNVVLAQGSNSNVVENGVDLTKYLKGWSVTERRGRRSLKMDDSDEDDEDLLEAVEDLMSLANGHRSSVIQGSNSNANSPPSIDKRKAVMQVQMELDDHESDSRNSDEKHYGIENPSVVHPKVKRQKVVLDVQIPTINDDSTQEEIEAHQKHYDDANKVSCIMASSMSPELQKTFENTWAYEMNQQLKEMFQAKESKERLDVVKSLMACKPKPEASISSINIILSNLPADYNQFVLSYQMNGKETSIMELHSLLQTTEQGIKKIDVPSTSAAPVLTVGHNAKKRKTSHSIWKGKAAQGKSDHGSKRKAESEIAPTSDPKEAVCFYCNIKGDWKRSCPKYLKDLKDEKVEKGGYSASPCKGIYETVECISNNGNVILNFGSSNKLDKSKLWQSRLGHVNKKRIAQLQKDGVLESFDFKSDDVCESCLLGKMTKSPFIGTCERVRYLGSIQKVSKRSREPTGQKDKVSQLTPPRTSQLNGVTERRNRTLLDMGCEVFVRREAQDKLEARSKKFLFITYPEESFGYLFYKPTDDVNPISEIDTQQEVVTPVEPDDISLPIRRTSSRVRKPPQFYYGFYIEEENISYSTLSEFGITDKLQGTGGDGQDYGPTPTLLKNFSIVAGDGVTDTT